MAEKSSRCMNLRSRAQQERPMERELVIVQRLANALDDSRL